MSSYCCTCAAPLHAVPASFPEKPPSNRQLPCCGRIVCARCLLTNARFATYCPYCQIATAPPPPSLPSLSEKPPTKAAGIDLLPQGLKPPPPYSRTAAAAGPPTAISPAADGPPPPPYASTRRDDDGDTQTKPPILHYLDHDRDSVVSLALRYRVPADRLRRANRLTTDSLLQARRVIYIPRSDDDDENDSSIAFSLSPVPVEGEAAARRKAAIRRFMVACKVVDYDVAVLYLEQTATDGDDGGGAAFDLDAAVAAYQADEQWARTHPMAPVKKKKKDDRTGSGRGFFSVRRRQPTPKSQ